MYCLKPFERETLLRVSRPVKAVLTVEEHAPFGGASYLTGYSNASRTQLFNIHDLIWDEELCGLFGLRQEWLATVTDSDSCFGRTDFGGLLERPIPIHGEVNYIIEGNINYTGAVITWLKESLGLIGSLEESEALASQANPQDPVYLVPAFTGLSAPYWDSRAQAAIIGMTRMTGKEEIVRAGLESIAYQIADVVAAMCEDMKAPLTELRVDGGPTRNRYLMQFQSDILGIQVRVPETEELSAFGAACAAGLALGVYRQISLIK